jgi:hypothetical protein
MNNCIGCGTELQTKDKNKIGYTINPEKKLCERCFRIRNYGEYKTIIKDNEEFLKILEEINKTNDLVLLVMDLYNLNKDLETIKKYIKNKMIIILTKRDILPKNIYEEKLLKYLENYNINYEDSIIISSMKNYNFDKLYEIINKNKTSKNVYVIGNTNAGKSTMINKLIYNYSNLETEITTSNLPSTTLNKITIKLNDDLNIIDTPGILEEKSLYNYIDGKELKRIIPKKEIKPINFQIKQKQWILIDKYAIIEAEKMDLIIYSSNSLDIKRIYKKPDNKMIEHNCIVKNNDIVIKGLCFIKCIGKGNITISTKNNIDVYTRKNLI